MSKDIDVKDVIVVSTNITKSIKKKEKVHSNLLEFSKFRFYLLLQGIVLFSILLYQLVWFVFGETTIANCKANFHATHGHKDLEENSGTLLYNYYAGEYFYEDYTTRNGTPLAQTEVEIKFLRFAPNISRLNTYEGNWLGFIIAYGIFFTITSLIFLIPNDTMPANSYIYFSRQKPWVHMIVK
jgi:hypothetical protein